MVALLDETTRDADPRGLRERRELPEGIRLVDRRRQEDRDEDLEPGEEWGWVFSF